MLAIIRQAEVNKGKVAILSEGLSYSYENLLNASRTLANRLLNDVADLNEQRVAFMVEPGFNYVSTLWAIWQSGGIAVPFCLTHPLPSLQYVLEDTQSSTVIVSSAYAHLFEKEITANSIRLVNLDVKEALAVETSLPVIDENRRAMILYTSGTTNKPKGVVTTHANLNAQISTLVDAWEWSSIDHTICVLPLHHVHGIINVVCCSLWSGAICEFLPSFSAKAVFDAFLEGKINVFMAVPTIYFKLIAYWESLMTMNQEELTECMGKFRLMVCGSAALPVSIMEKWRRISGQTLLERYGMTEIGMAISNPYDGERRAGFVGLALPGVSVRLVDENYQNTTGPESGEIIIKGANVFREYWNRPEATHNSFTDDDWFKTGDIAMVEDGYYRILGRNSVDIIKSGGYKISALEIEEALRDNELIIDCAVVGVPDEEWGELIVAAIITSQTDVDLSALNLWLRNKIAPYKTPRKYLLVDELPKNAMGKVVKNDVKNLFK
jgi:malonyl-CoA/methylmalonyl-CoA synthetase